MRYAQRNGWIQIPFLKTGDVLDPSHMVKSKSATKELISHKLAQLVGNMFQMVWRGLNAKHRHHSTQNLCGAGSSSLHDRLYLRISMNGEGTLRHMLDPVALP